MLPHRFHLRPDGRPDAVDQTPRLLTQATIVLVVVLMLALLTAFAAEALSLLAPSESIAALP